MMEERRRGGLGRLRRSGSVDVDDGVGACRPSVYGVDAGVGAALGLPSSPQKRRLFVRSVLGFWEAWALSLPSLALCLGWRWRQSDRWLQLLFANYFQMFATTEYGQEGSRRFSANMNLFVWK